MANRKTFDVNAFKDYVNEQLSRTDDYATESFKSALCVALEHVLHKTNNYKGYNDLYWNEIGFNQWWNKYKLNDSNQNDESEIWENKKVYIYGDEKSKYKGNKYARKYY